MNSNGLRHYVYTMAYSHGIYSEYSVGQKVIRDCNCPSSFSSLQLVIHLLLEEYFFKKYLLPGFSYVNACGNILSIYLSIF